MPARMHLLSHRKFVVTTMRQFMIAPNVNAFNLYTDYDSIDNCETKVYVECIWIDSSNYGNATLFK